MKLVAVLLLLSSLVAASEGTGPVIHEVLPATLFVEAGGKQINGILRGEQLQLFKEARVVRGGQVMRTFFLRLGVSSTNRRTFTLLASPQCLPGDGYEIQGVLADDSFLSWPLKLVVVPLGDSKATPPDTASLAESAQVSSGQRIVVSEKVAPVITGTVPSPLMVPPDGKVYKLMIKGSNLQGITEVRIRKSGKEARYKGNQGLVPFRYVDQGIEVEVVAGVNTAVGSKFVIDLMVKKYLAASALLVVGSLPSTTPVLPSETQQVSEEIRTAPGG